MKTVSGAKRYWKCVTAAETEKGDRKRRQKKETEKGDRKRRQKKETEKGDRKRRQKKETEKLYV